MWGHGCEPFGRAGGAALGVVDGFAVVDEPPDVAASATTAVPTARAPATATATKVALMCRGIGVHLLVSVGTLDSQFIPPAAGTGLRIAWDFVPARDRGYDRGGERKRGVSQRNG